jgi:hypothetical protein
MKEKVSKMGTCPKRLVEIFSQKISGFLYVLVLKIPTFRVFEGFSKGVFEINGAKPKTNFVGFQRQQNILKTTSAHNILYSFRQRFFTNLPLINCQRNSSQFLNDLKHLTH